MTNNLFKYDLFFNSEINNILIYIASDPRSPVLILITSSTSETNIFPSPMSPVLAF